MDMATDKTTLIDAPSGAPIANPETSTRRTRSATKTRMAGHEGPGLHYKHVRTTVVLLMNSTVFREFTLDEQNAFREIEKLNFDLSASTGTTLEYAFAKLDDDVMARVRDEFEFVKGLTSIRNHKACIATCALCGKGDSKDDGSNRDKLQYDFRLLNASGGTDLWVGSNCIVNFGLKVRGAETSEEARAILQRNLRECMSLWMKEAWRNDHPDHVEMEKHYKELETAAHDFKYYGRYGSMKHDIEALGQSQEMIYRRIASLLRPMRNALRFYRRADYLTEQKSEVWRLTKGLLYSLRWITTTLDGAADTWGERRASYLLKARADREAKIASLKANRKPRPMP
jgi:hypothetical protein